MALDDNAVITAAVGYVFTAPVGTTKPTAIELDALDLETFSGLNAAWEQVGHTSRDDMPAFAFDGGDITTKGTWQKKRLREIATGDPVADSVTIKLEQFDPSSLELYYGENATPGEDGVFGVSGDFVPVERALLVVIVDGAIRLGFHASKASVKRDDSIDLPVDGFAGLPIKATFLNHATDVLYSWISKALLSAAAAPVYTLHLGAATAGTYVLKVGSRNTVSLNYNATATEIKAALSGIDDGLAASLFTVTAASLDFTILSPLPVTKGTDSTTGGTGISVTVA